VICCFTAVPLGQRSSNIVGEQEDSQGQGEFHPRLAHHSVSHSHFLADGASLVNSKETDSRTEEHLNVADFLDLDSLLGILVIVVEGVHVSLNTLLTSSKLGVIHIACLTLSLQQSVHFINPINNNYNTL